MSTLFVDFHFLLSKVIFHPAFPASQTIPVPFFPPQASPCAWNPRRRCTGRSPLFSPGCRFWCIPVWMPGEQGHLPHSWHWGIPLSVRPLANLSRRTHSSIVQGLFTIVSVGRFSPFRVGLKTPISVNLKSPMHHVCY